MEPVINMPMSKMSTADFAACATIRRKAEELEWEDKDLIEALHEYLKAAAKGDELAFKEIVRIGKECNEPVQGAILQVMEDRNDEGCIPREDVEFVKAKADVFADEMTEDDLAKLLQIVIHYDILDESVQPLLDLLHAAKDAMDTAWMFPDGHDDGESSD